MAGGIVFLPSFHEAIKDLPDAERLGAYDAIIRYGLYGEIVDMTPLVKSLFVLIKPVVDASQNRYRASKENGKKGGRPLKNQTQNQTTNHDIYYENDNDTEKDKEKENDVVSKTEREEESLGGGGRTILPYKPLSEAEFEMMRNKKLAQLGC